MNHRNILRLGTLLLILIIVFSLWGSREASVQAEDNYEDIPWVDPVLLAKSKTSEPLDYLIFFDEQPDLSEAYGMSWEARGWYVFETLTALAEESQAEVRKYLDQEGVAYEAFWVQNVIAVQSSTSITMNGLLNFHEIHSLQSIPQIFLEEQPEIGPDDEILFWVSTKQPATWFRSRQIRPGPWASGVKGWCLAALTQVPVIPTKPWWALTAATLAPGTSAIIIIGGMRSINKKCPMTTMDTAVMLRELW